MQAHTAMSRQMLLMVFMSCFLFSADFQALSSQISKRKLDGAVVCIEQLSQTDSVLVENLPPGSNQDLLTLYFESERGGGQRVKDVNMLSEAAAKVSFVNFECE